MVSSPERVVGGGQDITWEWLKFIKGVLSLSEMSFYLQPPGLVLSLGVFCLSINKCKNLCLDYIF